MKVHELAGWLPVVTGGYHRTMGVEASNMGFEVGFKSVKPLVWHNDFQHHIFWDLTAQENMC